MGDFEKVKEAVSLKDYADSKLEKTRGGYVCPLCGSGKGKSKTPAFSIKGDMWKCFSCDKGGDVFDLAGIVHHLSADDKAGQLRAVADWAGIPIKDRRGGKYEEYSDWTVNFDGTEDEPRGGGRKGKPLDFDDVIGGHDEKRASGAADETPKTETKGEKKEAGEPDYSEGREKHRKYIAECAARLSDGYLAYLNDAPEDKTFTAVFDYLDKRGITMEEAITLGIGYDPKPAHGWQDEAGTWHNTPRIVIPWAGSDYYHIDRAIDNRAKNLKYDKPPSTPDDKHPLSECVGEQPVYNPQAFDGDYMVVVEGALDAIAVQLCGHPAIALGGTGVNNFATEAAARNYRGVVIDMLDCDGSADETDKGKRKGRGAGADLINLLGEAGITTLSRAEYGISETETYGGHKDAAEWLEESRDDLADMLEVMAGIARDKAKREQEANYREAMKHFSVKDPATVAREVLELRNIYEPIPTGIKALDDVLDGGVNKGELTVFGAISSYGKTTIAAQVADHMASAGRSVLFATLEQSAKELIAKSLSRLVYTENATGWNIATPSEITSLKARKAWGEGQRAALAKAVDDYNRMIAPRVKMLEGGDRPTVWNIRDVAKIMAEHDGESPVIFLDYLQLIAPLSDRYDDKKNADVNVSELRKMARDLNTHVWCISSLNRSSYSGVISLDSLKESGGIEYGADLVLGLQPRGMEEKLKDCAESKRKREADKLMRENKKKVDRDCELVILKRRNGAMPDEPIPLTFKTIAAYFSEPTKRE